MNDTLIIREDDKAVIRPAGDVTSATIPELRTAMKDAVGGGTQELVVDLVHTRMVDSSGLGLLIAAHNSLQKAGGKLSVIRASADILQLFQTMRMHQRFAVSSSETTGAVEIEGQLR
jgi:anti-anti-sigma factor